MRTVNNALNKFAFVVCYVWPEMTSINLPACTLYSKVSGILLVEKYPAHIRVVVDVVVMPGV